MWILYLNESSSGSHERIIPFVSININSSVLYSGPAVVKVLQKGIGWADDRTKDAVLNKI